MKPTFYLLLAGLFLAACSSMSGLQKLESKVPCIGSVGKEYSTLFKKEFQKVGEPTLATSVGVSLNSHAFDKKSYSKYAHYSKNLGKKAMVAYVDSVDTKTRFYTLKITDLVNLQSQFNSKKNEALKTYMATDNNLCLLSGISFVARPNLQEIIENAHHFYISDSKEGLTLEAHSGMGSTKIKMASLEVFDFSTAEVCWTKNKFGKNEVATFLVEGRSCPGDTEKTPKKLDDVASYLKFK
nr:hypothetical protein [Allomuricauda sp.]|tara:strand:+ start:457 stop:1176 length:720 start_codon:yes stop_codon:yes gene_type:complete